MKSALLAAGTIASLWALGFAGSLFAGRCLLCELNHLLARGLRAWAAWLDRPVHPEWPRW